MAKELRALGVDCASRKSGLAVLEGTKLLYHYPYTSLLRPGYSDKELAVELVRFWKFVNQTAKEYKVDIVVVEFTSGFRNHQTNRMLAYFEAAAMMGVAGTRIKLYRARTLKARTSALGTKFTEKQKAIAKIRRTYGKNLTEDEAEAIIFALAGINLLS
jgi:Holliday junction resolvasome RuvABC endonuclease subunit